MSAKLYTKTGDDGTTSSNLNTRLAKDAPLIEVYGCIDELSCAIDMVLTNKNTPQDLQKILHRTQQELSDLARELYDHTQILITENKIAQIEQNIDQLNTNLPEITNFVLHVDDLSAATCHLARAICRRTERRLVSLKTKPIILHYINRLSDLLFVIARCLQQEQRP